MSELNWNWVYCPYLDAPDKQKESALKAGYTKVCFKSEVDDIITELKQKLDKAIAERDGNQVCIDALKAEIKRKEGVGQRWFERCMEERTENVRLKRALFIAHAIKAKFKWWWITECKHNESCKILPDPRKIKKFTNTAWVCSKSQEKCRAKAEQYK